jgi:hypothetical protein
VANTYQLKITLRDTKPPIWRRVLVPGNLNLERLHRVIQDAMGWYDSHLHSFEVGGLEFGPPDTNGWGREIKSERQHPLERLVGEGGKFDYVYDFGDDWRHQILVEKVTTEATAPRCLGGARACPPEDCGGVWGYSDVVAAFLDEKHPRHAEIAEWVPVDWSPERFDLELADKLVEKHRPEPGRPRTSKSKSSRARA